MELSYCRAGRTYVAIVEDVLSTARENFNVQKRVEHQAPGLF